MVLLLIVLIIGCGGVRLKRHSLIYPEDTEMARSTISGVIARSVFVLGDTTNMHVTDEEFSSIKDVTIVFENIKYAEIENITVYGVSNEDEYKMKKYKMKSPYQVELKLQGKIVKTTIYTVSLKDAQRLAGAIDFMKNRKAGSP
jgi:hypothetical protein